MIGPRLENLSQNVYATMAAALTTMVHSHTGAIKMLLIPLYLLFCYIWCLRKWGGNKTENEYGLLKYVTYPIFSRLNSILVWLWSDFLFVKTK